MSGVLKEGVCMLYKIWKILSQCLSICFALCLIVSLCNTKVFDKGYSYDEKAPYEYPFAGLDDMCVDEEYIYCFNQYLQAVNVYKKEGAFEYSLKVPVRGNGKGCIYLKNGMFCICNDYGDVYQYQNGEFIYKSTINWDEEDENGVYQVIDKDGHIVATKDYVEYSELVGYFNDEIIVEEDWEAAIFENDWSVEDENGDVYEVNIFRTKLMKNEQAIKEQPFYKNIICSPAVAFWWLFTLAILQKIVEWIIEGRKA